MRKRIVYVTPVQTGKVFAVLYGIMSVPLGLSMVIASAFGAKGKPGIPFIVALIMPVTYIVLGFVFTVIGAWIYNLVAKWTGGIEFETQEQPNNLTTP